MRLYIKVKKHSLNEIVYSIFLILCFIPFLFPNPFVRTNIQPYAALVGTGILFFHFGTLVKTVYGRNVALILGGTFLVALLIMAVGGISVEAIRGVYNYFALFITPCAVIITLEKLKEFPEKLCKFMIVIWFLVASIQFFVYRGFATNLISAVRWSYGYRGVVGLASEPSFLGITSFYFLHIARNFKKQNIHYTVLILVMGIIFAQSTTGLMFIAGYYFVFLLDMINSKKGLYIWGGSIVALIAFSYYMTTRMTSSRVYEMIDTFFNEGLESVLTDGSASTRYNAIGRALSNAASRFFIPDGFGDRIGSAYGGLLVELGFFAFPAIILISYGFCLTFDKKRSRVMYFIVVTLLLLNNTQIGNPLLLMVIGINLYNHGKKRQGLGNHFHKTIGGIRQ